MSALLRLKVVLVVVALVGVGGVTAAVASGDGGRSKFATDLVGYEEVPALSTAGGGTFRAAISRSADEIRYELTYGGLVGTPTQSHIHFGQKSVAGGISVFLCSNLGNGPSGTQPCPVSGTVTGTFWPADVIGPVGQGIAAGEFAELVQALRAGVAYANVHSTVYPGGEIRGQLGDRHHGDDDAKVECSGAREDDELLGRPGHRDVAVDRSFDARAERLRVDEDDQVELEPLRQLRGQRPDAGRRRERAASIHRCR